MFIKSDPRNCTGVSVHCPFQIQTAVIKIIARFIWWVTLARVKKGSTCLWIFVKNWLIKAAHCCISQYLSVYHRNSNLQNFIVVGSTYLKSELNYYMGKTLHICFDRMKKRGKTLNLWFISCIMLFFFFFLHSMQHPASPRYRIRKQVGGTNRWRLPESLGGDLLGTAQAIKSINEPYNQSMVAILTGKFQTLILGEKCYVTMSNWAKSKIERKKNMVGKAPSLVQMGISCFQENAPERNLTRPTNPINLFRDSNWGNTSVFFVCLFVCLSF